MERYEFLIKKVIEGKKRLVYNFLGIEFILITLGVIFFTNQSDSRYFSIACLMILLATLVFIGFRMLNTDLMYCAEFYKVERVQVIRKLKMHNPLVKTVLYITDSKQLKVLIYKAHEAILYLNKYKERVEFDRYVIETDFDKNKNLKNEEESEQALDDEQCVNYYNNIVNLDRNLTELFNKLSVSLRYPMDLDYEENDGKFTFEVTYKVYGFIGNYTTTLLPFDHYEKITLNDNIELILDDSNFDSIKNDEDPYFYIIVNIRDFKDR